MTSLQYAADWINVQSYNQAFVGDYKEFMSLLPSSSVELILTDPPYGRSHLPIYMGLAKEAKRVLRIGGSLVTMCPNYMLPEVLHGMSQHLKYRWMIHYDYWHGSHARMLMGIEVTWKPLAWFVNQKLSPNRFISDSTRASVRDKSLHPWQQDMNWALYLIKRLTNEGDLVVDPFIGSGTVGAAAEMLGRQWLGCDIDEKAIETTNRRMKELRDEL